MAELSNIFANGFTAQAFINALTLIIDKILKFVIAEEGYEVA